MSEERIIYEYKTSDRLLTLQKNYITIDTKTYKDPILEIIEYKYYVLIMSIKNVYTFSKDRFELYRHVNEYKFIAYNNILYQFMTTANNGIYLHTINARLYKFRADMFVREYSDDPIEVFMKFRKDTGKKFDQNHLEEPMKIYERYPAILKLTRKGFLDIAIYTEKLDDP